MEQLLHRTTDESTYYAPPLGIQILRTTTNRYCSGQLFSMQGWQVYRCRSGQGLQGRVGVQVRVVGMQYCRYKVLQGCVLVCRSVCSSMQEYICRYVGIQACRYVCVCVYPCITNPLLCCLAIGTYIYIYIQTNVLLLAFAHAVLAEEDHSCNSRTLGVLDHCAACYSSSSRLRPRSAS